MQTVMHIRFIRPFPGTLAVIGIWLTIGTLGYHYLQSLPWLDALLNASMILSGMGPVNIPETTAGKWFSAFY
ncbi:MAG TPA: hypothetical protein VEC96_09335, partial [Anaerolineae bacterium]|nr:hypothetical protein [Anaerolineae bacterium]